MTMDYVRVRKSNIKELEQLLAQRKGADGHIVAAIVGMVLVVAVAGLTIVL